VGRAGSGDPRTTVGERTTNVFSTAYGLEPAAFFSGERYGESVAIS
jgi:hypothetical protein